MLNTTDNPLKILAWLSRRNQHIPVNDLAYMMELSDFPQENRVAQKQVSNTKSKAM